MAEQLFTDFDGTFDGVLARVIPVAANYTSEWAASAARYDCRVKVRYNKELMAQLEEGMMLAVNNFRGQSKLSIEKNLQRYTVMVISKIWPLHYGLGGVSDSHYYPLQMEVIEQALPDWDTDDQATMMIHLDAIPINYDMVVDSSGKVDFKKGFSYPLLGGKVHVINMETVDLIYNGKVKEALGYKKKTSSADPRKDPRIGLLRMFMESGKEVPIYVDLTKLVRYHFGVFSFTGGGKSNLMANLLRRILYHVTDTKLVLFDISCEYPFLLCDVFSDPKIPSRIILEEEASTADDFARTIVKPRDFEDDSKANEALKAVYDAGRVTFFNQPLAQVPTYGSIIEEMRELKADSSGKPTYVQAIDEVMAAVEAWMETSKKNDSDEIDSQFVEIFDGAAQAAVQAFFVSEKSNVYAWAKTRGKLKDSLGRAKKAKKSGVSAKDILRMLWGEERVICVSIADPETLRELVVSMTGSALRHRKRSFQIKPQMLFVFDEAQEFIPSGATGDVARCSRSVENTASTGQEVWTGRGYCYSEDSLREH